MCVPIPPLSRCFNTVTEVHGENKIRFERLPSDKTRLERRLIFSFVDIVSDQALEAPKILFKTPKK